MNFSTLGLPCECPYQFWFSHWDRYAGFTPSAMAKAVCVLPDSVMAPRTARRSSGPRICTTTLAEYGPMDVPP